MTYRHTLCFGLSGTHLASPSDQALFLFTNVWNPFWETLGHLNLHTSNAEMGQRFVKLPQYALTKFQSPFSRLSVCLIGVTLSLVFGLSRFATVLPSFLYLAWLFRLLLKIQRKWVFLVELFASISRIPIKWKNENARNSRFYHASGTEFHSLSEFSVLVKGFFLCNVQDFPLNLTGWIEEVYELEVFKCGRHAASFFNSNLRPVQLVHHHGNNQIRITLKLNSDPPIGIFMLISMIFDQENNSLLLESLSTWVLYKVLCNYTLHWRV